ncbi:MAG: TrapT dctQ-M fusion permease, dicarboxylate transport [uncultured Sulfurovum sp.]|uniref:TrapT dctQ-M fusion permease, dicarboxylate transport n=1 Tax=uncultured Sulfurovum sp. TaxID=269237 RepID=A0A6S6S4F9_9BACT|nr:MAG: TrapT dctQ-M fusion permease, dicarboxylate transport [uncultured Sulfurovum sp.]
MFLKLSYHLDNISKYSGYLASVFVVILSLLVAYDAGMRYLFSSGSIALQEIEWHLFDMVFLLGLTYALKHDKHVRVDIFFERYNPDTRAVVQICSMLLLVIPFSLLFLTDALAMTLQSFVQNEVSSDPGGLSHRWVIKGMLVVGFVLLVLQAISEILKAYDRLNNKTLLFKVLVGVALVATLVYLAWFNRMAFWIDPVFLMFALALFLLMLGFQVAFVFAGVALFFALITDEVGLHVLEMLPYRTYGIMGNVTLMAVPLFIFMGLILEKSKMAEGLLLSMGKLFGAVRGGLAISVVLVGAILAASTGIVGASVVMMSLIALPLMLKHNYSPALASGSISASGTLGQLIPPSIVLIILGDQMHLSVGDLFRAAVVPGLLLIGLYILYILVVSYLNKDLAPAIVSDEPYGDIVKDAIKEIIPPLLLIAVVLGSIFAGIASPSESAAIGVLGAVVLALTKKTFSFSMLRYAAIETVKLTAMIFMILIGATAFSLVFGELGGGDMAIDFFTGDMQDKWTFILIAMVVIFILGFFIDFIEIAFVVVPILVPIVALLGIDPIWFAILIAMNLQASFLTPPFGFALFYLKGAAGDKVSTGAIYKGVVPFILLQLMALGIIVMFPNLIYLFGE